MTEGFEVLDFSGYIPLAPTSLAPQEAVEQMPLSQAARGEMLRLLSAHGDRITEVPAERQRAYLENISYRTFLERYFDVREPEVFALLEGITTDIGLTIDSAPALYLLDYVGLPGVAATSLPTWGFEEVPQQVLANQGPCGGCPEDVNDDGIVNGQDVAAVATHFGPCP